MSNVWISPVEAVRIPDAQKVVLDVRHQVGTESKRSLYLENHLPAAVFVELREDLAGASDRGRGRNPLPELSELEAAARSWGIKTTSTVIVYADAGAPSAGRAWWTLKWAGVPDVRILEGGIQAWEDAGLPLTNSVPSPYPGNIRLHGGGFPDIDVNTVAEFGSEGQLIDAREAAEYSGLPDEPDSGHIPGSINIPYSELTDNDGKVDFDRARRLFAESGVSADRPVGFTCGGGVSAAFEVAIFSELGLDARLHVGSWSEWILDPGRPREVESNKQPARPLHT